MLDPHNQDLIVRAFENVAEILRAAASEARAVVSDVTVAAARLTDATKAMNSPHVRMRPRVYIDGNQWCALYGENIQDGVAGFGDSPAAAMAAFDKSWVESLAKVSTC